MNKRANFRLAPVIGFGLLILTAGVFIVGQERAAADAATSKKVQQLAAAIKAKDNKAIKDLTVDLAKVDVDELMEAFKTSKKGGILDEGIENKLQALAKAPLGAAALAKQAQELEDIAYVLAAVSEVTLAKGVPTGKNAKNWAGFSKGMKGVSEDLLKAVQAKNAGGVHEAAKKSIDNCAACHMEFR